MLQVTQPKRVSTKAYIILYIQLTTWRFVTWMLANLRSNVNNYQKLSESELIATTKDTNERDVDEATSSMNYVTKQGTSMILHLYLYINLTQLFVTRHFSCESRKYVVDFLKIILKC